jgi:nucleoside-diphosphate-sugar epimerase
LSDAPAIEVWGDGKQTRSFTYIDEAVEGVIRLVEKNHPEPVNIGSEEMVSIDELLSVVEECAGTNKRHRHYNLDAPKGVRGRNSDNTYIRRVLGWSPQMRLKDGIAKTYAWVSEQVKASFVPGKE